MATRSAPDTTGSTPPRLPSETAVAFLPDPIAAEDELAPPPGRGPRFSFGTFDSLRDPGFRWFFLAMMGQMTSMNMQMLVRGYLVYELTGSYAALGTVQLAGAAPMILFTLHGGVLADRVKHKQYVVQVGQFLSALNSLAVAALIISGTLSYEALLVAAVVQGVVQSLMMPARQAMIPEIIGLRRLMNAVALNSAGMNSMRLFAPGVGGFMLAVMGPEWVYFVMTGGYLWAVALLAKVPVNPSATVLAENAEAARSAVPRRRAANAGSMSEGLRYIIREPTLRAVLGINMLLILMSMPYMFLLPGFVDSVLHAGPERLGLLMSVTGAGSLVGSLVIASLPPRRRGLLFLLSSLFQGVMLIFFSISTWFWVTAPVMLVMGIGQSGRQSLSNVLVQAYTDDEHRGRVMSVFMLQFGLTSFGTFIVGVLAAIVGVQWALGATSALMVAFAGGAILFSPRLRNLD